MTVPGHRRQAAAPWAGHCGGAAQRVPDPTRPVLALRPRRDRPPWR